MLRRKANSIVYNTPTQYPRVERLLIPQLYVLSKYPCTIDCDLKRQRQVAHLVTYYSVQLWEKVAFKDSCNLLAHCKVFTDHYHACLLWWVLIYSPLKFHANAQTVDVSNIYTDSHAHYYVVHNNTVIKWHTPSPTHILVGCHTVEAKIYSRTDIFSDRRLQRS